MTKRDVLGIAIRILGLWTLVNLISSLPGLAYGLTGARAMPAAFEKRLFFMELVSCCISLIVGFYLLAYAKRIAAALMPEDGELGWPEWITRPGVLFGFGAGIFGLVLIVRNLPPVIVFIVQHIWGWCTRMAVYGRAADWLFFASQVILLAIGLGLLFGYRSIAAWIEGGKSGRSAGNGAQG